MKIRFVEIPHDGIKLNNVLPLESLQARIADDEGYGLRFESAPKFDLEVQRTPDGAEIRGTLEGDYLQMCGTCIEPVRRTFSIPFHHLIVALPQLRPGETRDGEEFFDDVGISYVETDSFELGNLLEEAIILSLSIYWAPERDSKGACVECKKVVNALPEESTPGTQSLGALLKRAGKPKQRT